MLWHQQPRGAHPCAFFTLQHSDGTFCVKPLKQKQVVSVGVSLHTLQGRH